MKIWKIVEELEQIYTYHFVDRLKEITSDDFQYVSDFENIKPMNRQQYEEYLPKQLEKFYHPHSLEVKEEHCCRKWIEIILQKDTHSSDFYIHSKKLDFTPFTEPRLLQCDIRDGQICRIHLCSPQDKKISDNMQKVLLESCKNNDLEAAKTAIENGAYAGLYDSGCIEFAAEFGSVELCQLLIADEADIQFFAWDTIFCAIRNPDVEVLKYLLQQNAPLDVVDEPMGKDHPMTPLDYAKFLHRLKAEKLLMERNAPTFSELKKWCFQTDDFKIRLSDSCEDGGDMSISAVGNEVNDACGLHIGQSSKLIWLELHDCFFFIVPFFLEYCSKPFDEYLEDNLVTLPDAQKGLQKIRDFLGTLDKDFDNPQVQKILSKTSPTGYIEWGKRSRLIEWYFSEEEKRLLWKAHRQALIAFYQDFCSRMENMISEAKKCGDCYITFVGP